MSNRPRLAKDTALAHAPLQNQKSKFKKPAVALPFVMGSYTEPHCAPQADQNTLCAVAVLVELVVQLESGLLLASTV